MKKVLAMSILTMKVTLSSLHEQLNGSPFDQPAEMEKSFDAPLLKSASTVYGELLSVSALLLTSCEELLSEAASIVQKRTMAMDFMRFQ